MAENLSTLSVGEPPIELTGYSVAGEETVVAAPGLDVMFDIGKAPRALLSVNHVCLSHGHMDHAAGLAYYFWQRDFQDNTPGTVLLPAALAAPAERMLRDWAAIEGHQAPFNLHPMNAGDRFEIRRDLFLEAFDVPHGKTVPSLGFVVFENRRKLKGEFAELTGPQIVALKNQGVQITDLFQMPQVAYLGDTEVFDFTANRLIAEARVLIAECTFFEDDHRSRARAGFHTHLQDVPHLLEMTQAQAVVLTHLTRRTGLRAARAALRKILHPPEQFARVHFLMDSK